jgi:hypothetical protein
MNRGITIPFEVADEIVLATLKQQLQYLEKEVKDHVETGSWMHPEDYRNSMTRLIPSLEIIIDHFGGNLE